ncbi:MAG: DUF3842 family protein [Eubacteriales bacterium]
MKKPVVVIIDGQGGRIGKLLAEQLSQKSDQIELICVGTNSIATSTMMKAGSARGATGENAVVVNCRTADFIIGPIGIAIADSMLGEITPAMARAVGQSSAVRLLIPFNHCGSVIIGVGTASIKDLIVQTISELDRQLGSRVEV